MDVLEVRAPESLADLALVEVEPPQEAVALHVAHGLLRHPQPLGDRFRLERHGVCPEGAWPIARRCVRSQSNRTRQ